jgi:hypothetical protein
MEFVKVTFPTARKVFVDGGFQDMVDSVFNVERGFHLFDLGAPPNYVPLTQLVQVIGTTEDNPTIIAFTPAMAAVHAARATARRRVARAAKVTTAAEEAGAAKAMAKRTATKKARRTAKKR